MRKPVTLGIIGLSVALWLCLLFGGVEYEKTIYLKVGGREWFGNKGERIKGDADPECDRAAEIQGTKPD